MAKRSASCFQWVPLAGAVGIALIAGCGVQTELEKEKRKPLIEVLEPHVDLGVFRIGGEKKQLEHAYKLAVWDESPVRVTSIETSCGCLAVVTDIVGKELPPNSNHVVLLRVNPSNGVGVRTEFARIVTEPPSPKPVMMTLRAAIIASPVVLPDPLIVAIRPTSAQPIKTKLFVNYLREKASPKLALDQANSSFGPFKIIDIHDSTKPSGKPGEQGYLLIRDELALTLAAEKSFPIGEHEFVFRLAWSNTEPTAMLPVKVRVLHPVELSLDRLFFGELLPGERRTAQVPMVRAWADAPRPDSIKCDLDFVEGKFNEAVDQLVVSVSAPTSSGRFEGTLTLSFGVDATPPIQLPISGVVTEHPPLE